MATMNFSIPDQIKDAFDREFVDQNKNAIIAELMQRAVAEAKQQRHRLETFHRLTASRDQRPKVSDTEIRVAREFVRS